MRYIVGRYHKICSVEYQEGQVIDIDDPEFAAWLTRDMRGHLTPIVPKPPAPEPEPVPEPERAVEAAPQDRMQRKPRRRSKP